MHERRDGRSREVNAGAVWVMVTVTVVYVGLGGGSGGYARWGLEGFGMRGFCTLL